MKRSQSMENLPMLPEEAKLAASLLRLTLSDKRETEESDFQSYITKHNHFPYHKTVPVTTLRQMSEPIPIQRPLMKTSSAVQINLAAQKQRRTLRRRCESTPITSSCEEEAVPNEVEPHLSQSAPAESFFHRLFSSLLKRKVVPEERQSEAESVPTNYVARSAPVPITGTIRGMCKCESIERSSQFICHFNNLSGKDNVDNLILLSMR